MTRLGTRGEYLKLDQKARISAPKIERGEILTPSLSEIIIPTSMDTPDVDTIILESDDGIGPFGAKGIGEPCIQSIAPAIANAIFDAIGMRIYELPITPEKILRALEIL